VGDRVFSSAPHTDYHISDCDNPRYVKPPDDITDEQMLFLSLSVVAMHAVERADIAFGQPVINWGR
jgi:hypothetical protein